MAEILVVEDEEDLREVIAEELEDAGYVIRTARNGEEGLTAILEQRPDLVLSDITMPKMNGHELLQELRDKHPTCRDIPFVYLSALADKQDVMAGLNLGADDYITKPIDFDLLLMKVQTRLRQVEKIETKKDAEMVRLYKALSPEAEESQASQGPAKPAAEESQPAQPPAKPAAVPRAEAAPAKPAASDRPSFADGVKAAISLNKGKLTAGRFQVIDIERIKDSLGDKWESRAERVLDAAERIIAANVTPEDAVRRNSQGEFIVCFPRLDPEQAAFKARSIRDEIWDHFFGQEGSQDGDLSTEDLAFCDISAEVNTVEVKAEEVTDDGSIVDLVTSRLKRVAERAHAQAMEVLADLSENGRMVVRQASTKAGQIAPFCLADFEPTIRKKIRRLTMARGDSESIRAEIDFLTLGLASELLFDIEDEAQLLVVPVEFSTIAAKRWQAKYRELCTTLTEEARSRLIFCVRNRPAHVPSSDTSIDQLSPFSRLRMLQVSEPRLSNCDLATSQISIVGINFDALERARQRDARRLGVFITSVHHGKARLLVDNIPDLNDARTGLIRLGADFLAGR